MLLECVSTEQPVLTDTSVSEKDYQPLPELATAGRGLTAKLPLNAVRVRG